MAITVVALLYVGLCSVSLSTKKPLSSFGSIVPAETTADIDYQVSGEPDIVLLHTTEWELECLESFDVDSECFESKAMIDE